MKIIRCLRAAASLSSWKVWLFVSLPVVFSAAILSSFFKNDVFLYVALFGYGPIAMALFGLLPMIFARLPEKSDGIDKDADAKP